MSFRFDEPKLGGKPADPKDWPATKVFTSTTGDCTATVIGSHVVLTAAHCVAAGSTGEIMIGGKPVEITCTHHPKYSSDDNYDVALCKAAASLGTGFLYEKVSTTALGLNTPVKILGFGCTTDGGSDFGALTDKTAGPKRWYGRSWQARPPVGIPVLKTRHRAETLVAP